MTQTLWSWVADNFWKMSGIQSVNPPLIRTIQLILSVFLCESTFTLLTGHCDQLLRGKRLLPTRHIQSSDRLHILRDKGEKGSGWHHITVGKRSIVFFFFFFYIRHLPWQVNWCLEAHGGFSKSNKIKSAFVVFILQKCFFIKLKA